jgi:hypothetical protein
VSSDSMKNATATSQGRSRLVVGVGTASAATGHAAGLYVSVLASWPPSLRPASGREFWDGC